MNPPASSRTRRPRLRRLALLCAAALATLLIPAVQDLPAAAVTPPVSLPADEAAHPSAGMEWWYFTGHLTGKDILGKSHSYGFETMVTRNDGLNTAPHGVIYNVNMSVTDLTRGTFKEARDLYAIEDDTAPAGGGFILDVAGEPGEVLVKGFGIMRGYYGDPAATAETIRDGWLSTGDIGILDEAGNLRITDQIKDMFIVGGFNAYLGARSVVRAPASSP